jgi:hypothetical protein
MMHIYDWIDLPAKDDGETLAKTWFNQFCKPAMDKDRKWLSEHKLFCTYKGKKYRCIGASRLGDVWLTEHFERENGYDLRIDVADCSDWSDKQ